MRVVHGKLVCESLEEVLDPDSCAVIVVDLQNDAMRPEGNLAKAGNDISRLVEVLPRCAAFVKEARRLGVQVIHARTITLPYGRSQSPSWIRALGRIAGTSEMLLEGTWGAAICDEVQPRPGEVVITKHRSSAFTGTNLDAVLRAQAIRTVVIIGEQTPGCVEATYRDAAYHDYYNVLVEDCVAALSAELHEASLMIQRARHDVCTADQVLNIWRKARSQKVESAPKSPDLEIRATP